LNQLTTILFCTVESINQYRMCSAVEFFVFVENHAEWSVHCVTSARD